MVSNKGAGKRRASSAGPKRKPAERQAEAGQEAERNRPAGELEPKAQAAKVPAGKARIRKKARNGKPPAELPANRDPSAIRDAGMAVVGIGASAGGIESISRFLEAMPVDSGVAFVVVLHLDPTHDSQLATILGYRTTMPVVEIEDGMPIEPDRVHVIVPARSLTTTEDRFRLTPPIAPRGFRRPVDILFESLAREYRERAIGIVMSGTGTNGTHGLRAIREQGGLTIAETPESARFDGMPNSAIHAGMVDFVLPPEDLPQAILGYLHHDYATSRFGTRDGLPDTPSSLEPILAATRARSGPDFRDYKSSTLLRRVFRRMSLTDKTSLADYAGLLQADQTETAALICDLLINVTGFWRDPEAWEALAQTVLEPLFAASETDAEIRFWVPACSTGEEAYTLAMLAIEQAEAAGKTLRLKVFATDIQEANLAVARNGVYLEAAVEALGPDRLRRFFERTDGSYRVRNELREVLLFAPHDLLRDPPFSRLHLISCRNILIYLRPEAQARILSLFHFGLREGGHLFLGSSETVGRQEHLYASLSKKWRIYRRIGQFRPDIEGFPVPHASRHRLVSAAVAAGPAPAPSGEFAEPGRIADMARQVLLARYAPASVLIDEKGRSLFFHGPTGDYLEPPDGEPTRDVAAMAREGLRARLRGAIRKATVQGTAQSFSGQVRQGETARHVAITVEPLEQKRLEGRVLLVSFLPVPAATPTEEQDHPAIAADSIAESVLEEELKSTRAELQSTIERMESANDELKASVEEITSMNEELQSSNEELEVSKEEMQSFNEELHTINSLLEHKNRQLADARNDIVNLISATDVAILFLDEHLTLKWFSPVSRRLFDFAATDVGRPIKSFSLNHVDPGLLPDAEAVLATLSPQEIELRGEDGGWLLRRLLPYRTQDNRISGVVATYIDISDRKAAADSIDSARVYSEAIVTTIRHPLLVLDGTLRVSSANRAFHALFQTSDAGVTGELLYQLADGGWDFPKLRAVLDDIATRGSDVTDLVIEHEFPGLGHRTILLNGRHLPLEHTGEDMILLAFEDITARHRAEHHRDQLMAEMNHRVKNTLATVQSIAWQTARHSSSLGGFRGTFEARLKALAQAHDLLIKNDWRGAGLEQIVDAALAPHRSEGSRRIVAGGPNLALPAPVSIGLTMILHELATNAAKYGALFHPNGRLHVTWSRDATTSPPKVALDWTETGGTGMAAALKPGFGMGLIERIGRHDLHGRAVFEVGETGLTCRLEFPGEEPTPDPPARARA